MTTSEETSALEMARNDRPIFWPRDGGEPVFAPQGHGDDDVEAVPATEAYSLPAIALSDDEDRFENARHDTPVLWTHGGSAVFAPRPVDVDDGGVLVVGFVTGQDGAATAEALQVRDMHSDARVARLINEWIPTLAGRQQANPSASAPAASGTGPMLRGGTDAGPAHPYGTAAVGPSVAPQPLIVNRHAFGPVETCGTSAIPGGLSGLRIRDEHLASQHGEALPRSDERRFQSLRRARCPAPIFTGRAAETGGTAVEDTG